MPVSKPATTSVPVHDLIRDRWSPRSFNGKPVAGDVLKSVFEAARWAASCNNSQPWRFVVETTGDRAGYEGALACFNERNQRWAGLAPVVGFVCAYKNLPNGNPSPTHAYDTGMGMAQLILQATSHGLVIHQAAGILRDNVREAYEVPEDTDIVCGFALGYQGAADLLPDELPEREAEPRKRHELGEMVFSGKFGNASPSIA